MSYMYSKGRISSWNLHTKQKRGQGTQCEWCGVQRHGDMCDVWPKTRVLRMCWACPKCVLPPEHDMVWGWDVDLEHPYTFLSWIATIALLSLKIKCDCAIEVFSSEMCWAVSKSTWVHISPLDHDVPPSNIFEVGSHGLSRAGRVRLAW